jgi:hypothetical protein
VFCGPKPAAIITRDRRAAQAKSFRSTSVKAIRVPAIQSRGVTVFSP